MARPKIYGDHKDMAFRTTTDMARDIKELADAAGVSISVYIVRVLAAHLKKQKAGK